MARRAAAARAAFTAAAACKRFQPWASRALASTLSCAVMSTATLSLSAAEKSVLSDGAALAVFVFPAALRTFRVVARTGADTPAVVFSAETAPAAASRRPAEAEDVGFRSSVVSSVVAPLIIPSASLALYRSPSSVLASPRRLPKGVAVAAANGALVTGERTPSAEAGRKQPTMSVLSSPPLAPLSPSLSFPSSRRLAFSSSPLPLAGVADLASVSAIPARRAVCASPAACASARTARYASAAARSCACALLPVAAEPSSCSSIAASSRNTAGTKRMPRGGVAIVAGFRQQGN